MQRALIQYRNPANYNLVKEALVKAGRTDLIGFDEHCLIRPRQFAKEKQDAAPKRKGTNVQKKKAGTRVNSKNRVDTKNNRVRSGKRNKTEKRR